MKKIIISLLVIIGVIGILNQSTVVNYIMKNYLYHNEIVIPESDTEYQKNQTFSYVKEVNDFEPHNKQDVLNIIYTTLNHGWDEFSFYCAEDYKNCSDEITNIFKDQSTLSNLNNFVHPYHSYNTLTVDITSLNQITVHVKYLYSKEQKLKINQRIDEIYNQLISSTMSERDQILAIHDYIINNTVYDEALSNAILSGEAENNNSNAHTAYGLLFENKAICGGYADTMALFLDRMGIPNMKVSTYDHVWNAVQLEDGKWYHLDLTWDDPVTSTHENILTHTFFLLTTEQLQTQNTGQHDFDKKIYSELLLS